MTFGAHGVLYGRYRRTTNTTKKSDGLIWYLVENKASYTVDRGGTEYLCDADVFNYSSLVYSIRVYVKVTECTNDLIITYLQTEGTETDFAHMTKKTLL